ncbi:hypothetical protein PXH59_00410 (plasmid) [Xenorhabdus sp. SF857]|uniref:hypothetical protein n=1 Tax=Xenorhabdus bakwenae TaxID=3026967 RepID=UPI0025580F3B|nr:hypothetical protein [Xenorhabdus sp. SF857]WFQ78144.1 hypothetical protein PXH59_00410 [Xenorhabdus sp. SF857]
MMGEPLQELIESTRDLNQSVETKINDINNKVTSAKKDFEDFAKKLNVISGFEAINYNGDFMDTVEIKNSKGEANIFPVGLGMSTKRNDCVRAEMIPVISGEDPGTRNPEAIELLKFMGIGDVKYFSEDFNIMKITITDTSFINLEHYDFYIPEQHVKCSPSYTYMAYYKTIGDFGVSYLGNSQGKWERAFLQNSHTSPGDYIHIDLNFSDNVKIGDILYLALPTICTGLFPKEYMHGNLYNMRENHMRSHHPRTTE